MLELKSNSNQDLVEDKEDTFIYGSFAASNIRKYYFINFFFF